MANLVASTNTLSIILLGHVGCESVQSCLCTGGRFVEAFLTPTAGGILHSQLYNAIRQLKHRENIEHR